MGRELRRVPLDFDWPLNERWKGFCNPHYTAEKCEACDSTGYSTVAKRLHDQWYGYAPFSPEDRGSVPLTPDHPGVRAFAERNVAYAPDFYGVGERALLRESQRLCELWNAQWSHHLNADDVGALVAAGRLMDFTHTWSKETGWKPKEPAYIPTPQEVNDWSLHGVGHDSINHWRCIKAECERLGETHTCAVCDGDGEIWPSEEAHKLYEAWEEYDPPEGEAYQIWETVSEGSPISPPFASPEALARYMAGKKWGADDGTPYETWLAFIRGPGWAPSMVMAAGKMMSGVVASVDHLGVRRQKPSRGWSRHVRRLKAAA